MSATKFFRKKKAISVISFALVGTAMHVPSYAQSYGEGFAQGADAGRRMAEGWINSYYQAKARRQADEQRQKAEQAVRQADEDRQKAEPQIDLERQKAEQQETAAREAQNGRFNDSVWLLVLKKPDNSFWSIDLVSMKKGPITTFWTKTNHLTQADRAAGGAYAVSQIGMVCDQHTFNVRKTIVYDAGDRIISSQESPDRQFLVIQPGSAAEGLQKEACS